MDDNKYEFKICKKMAGKDQNAGLIPERVMGRVILIYPVAPKFIDLFSQRKINRMVYALEGPEFGDTVMAGQ